MAFYMLVLLLAVDIAVNVWDAIESKRRDDWMRLTLIPFFDSIPRIIRGQDGPPPTPADP